MRRDENELNIECERCRLGCELGENVRRCRWVEREEGQRSTRGVVKPREEGFRVDLGGHDPPSHNNDS